jgi:hypothetical protein
MELIDEIKDDGHCLIVDPQILQISDQLRSRDINLRKAAAFSVLTLAKPARLQPMVKRFNIDPCLHDKFTRLHGYISIAWRGL